MSDYFPDSKVRHGTPSGFTKHQNLGERPCDACYQSKAEYDARRKDQPAERKRSRDHARAQGRATTVIRARHTEEYRALYLWFKDHPDTTAADVPPYIGRVDDRTADR